MIRTSIMADEEFATFLSMHSVSGGKGDSAVQSTERSTQGFDKELQNAFQQQFGNNEAVLNFLNGKLTNQVLNPTGFSAPTLATLNTNNIESNANAFAKAQQATQASIAAKGGSTLPSGVGAQLTAANANAAAASEATGTNQIALANEQQKQTNYWNAVSGLNSVASGYNPLGYAGASNQSGGTLAGLSEANSNANKVGFFNTLEDSFGSALGKGLGAAAGAQV